MNRVGILATLQPRPGKEAEVEQFLQFALPLVDPETGATVWFAKIGPATFGIFETFKDEEEAESSHKRSSCQGALRESRGTLCYASPDPDRGYPRREAPIEVERSKYIAN